MSIWCAWESAVSGILVFFWNCVGPFRVHEHWPFPDRLFARTRNMATHHTRPEKGCTKDPTYQSIKLRSFWGWLHSMWHLHGVRIDSMRMCVKLYVFSCVFPVEVCVLNGCYVDLFPKHYRNIHCIFIPFFFIEICLKLFFCGFFFCCCCIFHSWTRCTLHLLHYLIQSDRFNQIGNWKVQFYYYTAFIQRKIQRINVKCRACSTRFLLPMTKVLVAKEKLFET